jgi:hypothetical protein
MSGPVLRTIQNQTHNEQANFACNYRQDLIATSARVLVRLTLLAGLRGNRGRTFWGIAGLLVRILLLCLLLVTLGLIIARSAGLLRRLFVLIFRVALIKMVIITVLPLPLLTLRGNNALLPLLRLGLRAGRPGRRT